MLEGCLALASAISILYASFATGSSTPIGYLTQSLMFLGFSVCMSDGEGWGWEWTCWPLASSLAKLVWETLDSSRQFGAKSLSISIHPRGWQVPLPSIDPLFTRREAVLALLVYGSRGTSHQELPNPKTQSCDLLSPHRGKLTFPRKRPQKAVPAPV